MEGSRARDAAKPSNIALVGHSALLFERVKRGFEWNSRKYEAFGI